MKHFLIDSIIYLGNSNLEQIPIEYEEAMTKFMEIVKVFMLFMVGATLLTQIIPRR
jgi:hypothetical protein